MARGKTICFIDDQNILHGQRDNWRIDWHKSIKFLSRNDEEVWQVYYFAGEKENQSEGEAGYFQFLKEEMRWEVSTYPLGNRTFKCVNCGESHNYLTEKGVMSDWRSRC